MAEIRVMATDLRFPEGPLAMADGSVILGEIAGGTVTRVMPDGTKTVVSAAGGGPNGLALGPDGTLYPGTFVDKKQTVTVIKPGKAG